MKVCVWLVDSGCVAESSFAAHVIEGVVGKGAEQVWVWSVWILDVVGWLECLKQFRWSY